MPRIIDKFPQKRGLGDALYNPLRSGVAGWSDPLSAIDDAAQSAGSGIRDLIESAFDQALDGLVDAVMDATGIDLSEPVALLEQLLAIPLEFLGGTTSLGDAMDVLGQFLPFLSGADPGSFDPTSAAAEWLTPFLSLESILDPTTGLIPEWLLPPTSVGRLTGGLSSIIPDGLFSLIPSGGDSTDRWFQLPTGGSGGSGALAILGTGSADEIVGKPFGVSEGQTLSLSGLVSWDSATGSAGSVLLNLLEFSGQTQVGTVNVGSVTPSGTSSWMPLSMDYTVPAGVDMIALAPAVTDGFSGGTALFSNLTGTSTIPEGGLFEQAWTKRLPEDLAYQLDNLTALVKAGLGGFGLPTIGDLPSLIDDFGGGLGGLNSGVGGLAGLFDLDPGDLASGPDLEDTWNALWADKLKQLNWVPNISQNTVDGVWNGWANLGDGLDSGMAESVVPAAIAGLLKKNLNNSSAIAAAEAAIRALQSAGNTLSDDFIGASASTLGASYNTLTSAGGGAGTVGLDGSGNAVWKVSGSGSRTMIYRYTPSQITTDSAILRAVLSSTPPTSTDAYTYACGWVHTSAQTYLRLRIDASTVALQAVVSGTVYTLKTWSLALSSGDTVQLQRGQAGNTSLHRYILSVNGITVDDFTDGTSRASSGSGVRGMGLGMETSLRLTIWGPTQWQPAGLANVTFAEVL